MATTSITAAVKNKYEQLSASNFPDGTLVPIHFGRAPSVDGWSEQLRPPYVAFSEAVRDVKQLDFERANLVTVRLTVDVCASELGDVDLIVNAIRWNGGGVGDGLGFDHGTLPELSSPRSVHQLIPIGEPRRVERDLGQSGQRVHGARMEYRLTVLESA